MMTRAHILAAAAFLMLSCTWEPAAPEVPEVPASMVVITAEVPDTRTAMGPKEGNAWANRWNEGDAISVNGVASDPLTADYEGASSAEFTVSEVQAPYVAGYPAAAFSNFNGTSASVRIAPEQQYVPGSYDPEAFVMMGSSDGGSIAFTPAVTLFRITVACDPSVLINSVKISSSNINKALTGGFSTDFNSLKPTGAYRNYVMVSSSKGIPGGQPVTLVMAPSDFTSDGFNVEITFKDGRKLTRTAKPSKAYKAGRIYSASINPTELRVAYYNILRPSNRTETAHLLDDSTVYRSLGRAIMNTGADVIGFGEIDTNALPGGFADLTAAWAQNVYEWSLDWPNDISRHIYWTGYYYNTSCAYSNGFAYNPSVLRLEDSGYVWLQKGGTGYYTSAQSAYDNAGSPERTVVWARFTHIMSGAGFWFFVTHLPTEKQGGGENMAGGVNAFTAALAGSEPSILVGDMNSSESDSNSAPIMVLLEEWTDSYDSALQFGGAGDCTTYSGTLSGSSDKYYYTWETFTKNHPERRIDRIMTRGGMRATGYSTVRTTYSYNGKAWCPSDHLPVVATVVFN